MTEKGENEGSFYEKRPGMKQRGICTKGCQLEMNMVILQDSTPQNVDIENVEKINGDIANVLW